MGFFPLIYKTPSKASREEKITVKWTRGFRCKSCGGTLFLLQSVFYKLKIEFFIIDQITNEPCKFHRVRFAFSSHLEGDYDSILRERLNLFFSRISANGSLQELKMKKKNEISGQIKLSEFGIFKRFIFDQTGLVRRGRGIQKLSRAITAINQFLRILFYL